jgi:methylase of polypeptide subunit release factors
VQQSDLFSAIGAPQFDAIAFNPPFLLGDPQSTADRAFYGGLNFDVIRNFAACVRAHLRPEGAIYLVVSTDIDIAAIEQIFRDQSFTISRVLSSEWLLGEAMVILCAQ